MTLVYRSSQPSSRFAGAARRICAGLGRAALAGLLLGALALPAAARTAPGTGGFAGLVPLSDDELRAKRGGFMINGVDIDFGAVVQVLVNNTVVAETHLMLNSDGTMSRSTTIHDSTLASEFTDPSQLAGSGIQVSKPGGSSGFVIKDSSGVSLALNHITAGKILGLLANSAVDRNITQTIDATLNINNFSQINAGLLSNIAAGRAMHAGAPDLMLP
jgi:hypothetical protein